MSKLPIRKLTLYKQGIGFFERRGELEHAVVSLVVPRDSINDVLKSVAVTLPQGGQVLGIDYETPEDKQKALDEVIVKMQDRSSMVDLLSSLRGSHITLRLANGRAITGRLVGVEASLDLATHPASVLIQEDDDVSQIHIVLIKQLMGIALHNEKAAKDVGFFLDLNQIEEARTTLTVRLADKTPEAQITYLAPGPTWRVGYRLVGVGPNQARLSGWALFENHLDEDLDQVSLTLISGRPISFEYELYESYIPTRPQVSDDPTALETASDNPLVLESLHTITHELRTPLTVAKSYAELFERASTLTEKQQQYIQGIRQSLDRMHEQLSNLLGMVRLEDDADDKETIPMMVRAGPLGDLKVSSAYFKPVVMGNAKPEYMTYTVETPVSVRRGRSAMVPIIDQTVAYTESCVYNSDKMPNHPLRVWQLKNTTGKALVQGPVTISDADTYLGEGLLRFTGVGDEIHIPYALEFGILVSEIYEQGATGLCDVVFDADERRAVVSRYQIRKHIYTLTSHLVKDITVFIEERDPSLGTYHEMPEPALTMGEHTRWAVSVPANATAQFTVKIRKVDERYERIRDWPIDFIQDLHDAALLPDETYAQLENLCDERRKARAAKDQIKDLQAEYAQVVSGQEQLRKNLNILGKSKHEVKIRDHILDDLEASENRRRKLEHIIAGLHAEVEACQENQQALVDAIYEGAEGRGEVTLS
jgi:small nuclear ribonucleoprotein (snRNP)-like protein